MANRLKRLTQYFDDTTAHALRLSLSREFRSRLRVCVCIYKHTRIFDDGDDDDVRQARKLSFNRLVMLH